MRFLIERSVCKINVLYEIVCQPNRVRTKKGEIIKRLFQIVLLVNFAMIISCSSSAIFVEKDYVNNNVNGSNLMIIVMDTNPKIHYDGDLEPEFGKGNSNELIFSFFKNQLRNDILLLTKFKDVCLQTEPITLYYVIRDVVVRSRENVSKDKDTVHVKIPKANTKINVNGTIPDMVLFVDDVSLGTQWEAGGPGGPGARTKLLVYNSNFCLWDNRQSRIVSSGHYDEGVSSFFNVVTKSTWISASQFYVRAIFGYTPFQSFAVMKR